MPAQFDSFGLRFLYPDNWEQVARDESDGDAGVTFDLPGGGFLSIEVTESTDRETLVEGIIETISSDYDDMEQEAVEMELLPEGSTSFDLQFYYLDLLIISRIAIIGDLPAIGEGNDLVIQLQAESRDFDRNVPVLSALLKQIL